MPVTMLEARIEARRSFQQTLGGGDNAFVYVLTGIATVGEGGFAVRAGQLAWLTHSDSHGCSEVTLAAAKGATRVLMFAGPPLHEPIAFGGPFVMNTQAEIQQAFAGFQAGRF